MRADYALVVKQEAAFRDLLRALLAPRADDPAAVPRRPGNRLRYLAEALAPIHDQLGAERLQRLVMALAMCVGMESIIVMEDICGLTPTAAETVKRWAAAALLQAAVNEVALPQGGATAGDAGLDPG